MRLTSSGVAPTVIVRQENVPMASELVSLIRGDASIAEIASLLDAMPAAARRSAVDALGRRDQAQLFDKAEGRASRDDGQTDQILDYWFTLCRQDDIPS